jgi:acetyltransferase-like isoleucine patch superfamily enzyme
MIISTAKKLICGSGEFAELIFNTLKQNKNSDNIIGFWDNHKTKKNNLLGYKVFSDVNDLNGKEVYMGITMQNQKGQNFIREKASFVESCGGKVIGFCLSKSTRTEFIENSSIIFEEVYLDSNCKVKNLCTLRTRSYIGHNAYIGDCSYIAPNAVIGSKCYLEKDIFVGYGALILPNIKIGKNVLISAGSVVNKNVPKNSVFKRDGKIISMSNPFKLI